jgi:hypothetical protein
MIAYCFALFIGWGVVGFLTHMTVDWWRT